MLKTVVFVSIIFVLVLSFLSFVIYGGATDIKTEEGLISNEICPLPDDVDEMCRPSRTCANVVYGEYNLDDSVYDSYENRNVFDLWLADSDSPTPLLIFIHGGGFHHGSKEDIFDHCYRNQETSLIDIFLDAGVSVASINYRLVDEEHAEGAFTDEWYQEFQYPAPMTDSAKVLDFFRHYSKDYNIDPDKIAITGTSAGGGIAFWLAFHDDILDKSTRPNCVGPWKGQSTYDPRVVSELVPGAYKDKYMLGLYGIDRRDFDLEDADVYDTLFDEASPITHLTEDDAPVFMYYSQPHMVDGEVRGMHNPAFGLYAETFLQELDIPYELHFPEHGGLSEYQAAVKMRDFFFEHCF